MLSPEDAQKDVLCRKCNNVLSKVNADSFTSIKEVIDNGILMRRVEQFADSAEQIQEREHLSDLNKKKDSL
jgi:hypothetical protein